MTTVVLKGGISVDADALRLAWSLEERGVRLLIDADGNLRAGPQGLLTQADVNAISAARYELTRIVEYVSRLMAVAG